MGNEDLAKLKIDKSEAVHGPTNRKRLLRAAVALAIFLLLIALYLSGVFTPAVAVETTSVSQIYPSQGFTLLNASGYVVAQRKAAIASKATGRLVSLSVEEGSRVKKGDVVARLESEDVAATRQQAEENLNAAKAALDQAKAELYDAKVEFNRSGELVSKGFISRTDFDTAEARYKKAVAGAASAEANIKAGRAALQGAQAAVEYTLIRAPFDAVVLTKNADIGDMVTPFGAAANAKAAVVTIADMGSLQVEVDVSESNIEKVQKGQPCEIQLDAFPEVRLRGVVHMIVPTADRTKATVLVKVAFLDKDDRILPEMSAKVAFLKRPVAAGEDRPHTAINPSSIITKGGRKFVFLVKDSRVIETPITTGAQIADMTEVTAGLKAGDKIVLKPSGRLKTGSTIKIAEH
ncbi:MAG TPA: efflux RND transporter periplasmic adaptor subunit [Candidatus Sulfobium mesophilum]|nr:efflux RND transporter periplasmic adaptor subunit [Candidatus Sulfobium mesophilum]